MKAKGLCPLNPARREGPPVTAIKSELGSAISGAVCLCRNATAIGLMTDRDRRPRQNHLEIGLKVGDRLVFERLSGEVVEVRTPMLWRA